MRRFLPSPAMTVALLALIMSTTGTTIAATQLLPRNTVGSAQIKDRSIVLTDLTAPTIISLKRPGGAAGGVLGGTYPRPTFAAGAVTSTALADGAVSASKIADLSLTGAKFAEGSINGSKLMSGTIDGGALEPNEPWHVLGAAGETPFAPLWGSSSFNPLYNPASYRIDRFGVVHLRGAAWRGSDSVTGSTMFTLPVGYRPLKNIVFAVGSESTVGRLGVDGNGQVWVDGAVDDDMVSLDSVSFVAGE